MEIFEIIDQYNLLLLYGIPLLFLIIYFIVGFWRGVRKQRFKAISNLIILLIFFFFLLNPMTNFLYKMDIKFLLSYIELSEEIYDPVTFPGTVNLAGLVENYIKNQVDIELSEDILKVFHSTAKIPVRIVAALLFVLILFPIIKLFLSFIWFFKFSDGKKKKKIRKEAISRKNDADFIYKPFKKKRLYGALIGACYGFIIGVIVLMPITGLLSIAVPEKGSKVNNANATEIKEAMDEEDYQQTLLNVSGYATDTRKKFIGSLFGADKAFLDKFLFIETSSGKIKIRKEVNTAYNAIYKILESCPENKKIEDYILEISEEEFGKMIKALEDLEIIDSAIKLAISMMDSFDDVEEWAETYNIDLEKLKTDLMAINYNKEFSYLGTILLNAYGIMHDLEIDLKEIEGSEIDYTKISPEHVNNILEAVTDSDLFMKVIVPVGLQMLLNQEELKKNIGEFLSEEDINDIVKLIGEDEILTLGKIYEKFLDVGFTSFQDISAIQELTDEQFEAFYIVIDTCFESKIISKLMPLGLRYALNEIEELKEINIPDDINYAEEIKTLLSIFRIISKTEGFDLDNLNFDIELVSKVTLKQIEDLEKELKKLALFNLNIDVFGEMIKDSVFSENSLTVPENIVWKDEIDNLFALIKLVIKADLDFMTLTDDFKQIKNMETVYIEELADILGSSNLLLGFIEPIVEDMLTNAGFAVSFEDINWKNELKYLLAAFKNIDDFDNIDVSTILGKIDTDAALNSKIICRIVIIKLDELVEQNEPMLFIPQAVKAGTSENRNIFYEGELKFFLDAIKIVLLDENKEVSMDIDNLDTNLIFKKFFKNPDAATSEKEYEVRDTVLKSKIITETIIQNIYKMTESEEKLILPAVNHYDIWYDQYQGDVLTHEGELKKLFKAVEILLPDGNINNIDINKLVGKFYIKSDQDILLNSWIIKESIIKNIKDQNESGMLEINDNTDWDIELPLLFSALEILIGDKSLEEIDVANTVSLFFDDDKQKVLLNSTIISDTIIKKIKEENTKGTLVVNESEFEWHDERDNQGNLIREGELKKLFSALKVLFDGQDMNLNDVDLSKMIGKFYDDTNQDILLESKIMKDTIIKKVKDENANGTLIVNESKFDWNIELKSLFKALKELVDEDQDLSSIDMMALLSKFYDDIKQPILLNSQIVRDTIADKIVKENADNNNLLVINISTDSEWQVELPRLFDALEILIGDESNGESKKIEDVKLDNMIDAFFTEANRNVLLLSTIISDSVIKKIEDEPTISPHTTRTSGNWKYELPRFFTALTIICPDSSTLNNVVIDFDRLINNSDTLVNSLIIEDMMIDKMTNEGFTYIIIPDDSIYKDFTMSADWWYVERTTLGDYIAGNRKGELLKLLDALDYIKPSEEGKGLNDIEVNSLMKSFRDYQAELLSSDIMKATLIAKIREANHLSHIRVDAEEQDRISWVNWGLELPHFLVAINELIGENGDLSSFDFDYNVFFNNTKRDKMLISSVLEETIVEKMKTEISTGSLKNALKLPNSTIYSDYTNFDWYRTYTSANKSSFTKGEVEKLLAGIACLIGADGSGTNPNILEEVNIDNLDIFFDDANRAVILSSDILKETFINNIPDASKGNSVFVKNQNNLSGEFASWIAWDEEIEDFIKATKVIFGDNPSLSDIGVNGLTAIGILFNPTGGGLLVLNGLTLVAKDADAEAKLRIIGSSQLYKDTINKYISSISGNLAISWPA